MRMAGDWRYVTKTDVESYRTAQSDAVRERFYAEVLKASEAAARAKGEKFDAKAFRKEFLEKASPDAIEMEVAYSPAGQYGGWLREHDIMAASTVSSLFTPDRPVPLQIVDARR
jgi:hypothetical protein